MPILEKNKDALSRTFLCSLNHAKIFITFIEWVFWKQKLVFDSLSVTVVNDVHVQRKFHNKATFILSSCISLEIIRNKINKQQICTISYIKT